MGTTNLSPYIVGCKECKLCKGGAYQLPPFLFAGSSTPSILVLAQNPGEIGDDKENQWRFDLAKLLDNSKDGGQIKTIYDIDFITSHGYKQMSKIFGDNWLTNGKFMYSNAVRCRTKGNAAPSDEMEQNCQGWTSQLPIPQVVVLMGKVAIRQFSGMVGKPELPFWKKVKLEKGGKTSYVIAIPHYAAMRSHADMDNAKRLFEQALEDAGVIL